MQTPLRAWRKTNTGPRESPVEVANSLAYTRASPPRLPPRAVLFLVLPLTAPSFLPQRLASSVILADHPLYIPLADDPSIVYPGDSDRCLSIEQLREPEHCFQTAPCNSTALCLSART